MLRLRGKENLWILSTVLILTVAMIPFSVEAQDDETRLHIRDSPISGVPVDGWVWVTVDIETPIAWDKTENGIIGWEFDVHVDPDVLTAWSAHAATLGYFLYDFADWNEYTDNYPNLLVGEINTTTGDMKDISEFIMGYTTLGKGAGGNSEPLWYGEDYGLCRLRFRSKSETAHSVIDITDAYYYVLAEPGADPPWERIPFDVVDDGHYNEWIPVHDIAITGVTRSKAEVYQGETVGVVVDVVNQGEIEETFDVTAYADLDTATIGDEISIGVESVTLESGSSTTASFTWNTTGVAEGTYTISAIAETVPDETDTDDNTYTDDTVEVLIAVSLPPVASFTYTPDTPTVGETVTFNASDSSDPDGTIESYDWDFDDDSSDTGEVVTHAYAAAGTYDVNLTVTDNDELTDSFSKSVKIRLLGVPVANFTYSPAVPIVNESVTFNASASDDPDGTIESYDWDFDDDSSDTGEVVTHAYAAAGTYDVNLTVTDNDELTDTLLMQITIHAPPVASFTYSPTEPAEGENVTFDASASDDPDGTIESYDWDFDDDSTGANMVVNHTYTTAGTYNVTLTVTDNDGLTDITSDQITVVEHDIAVTSVNVSATEVVVGESLSINATVKNEGDVAETFDVTVYANTTAVGNQTVTDLAVGSTETLTFSWNTTGFAAGNYTIKAEASTIPGETDTTDNSRTYGEVSLIPLEPPDASFTYSPVAPVAGENVTFDASASDDPDGTIESYDWDFDDDSTGSGEVANHTYAAAGTYNVTLTVTDNDGLTDTYTAAITVASGQPEEVHDVALTGVTASPATVSVGGSVSVNVVVKNEGTETETFNVTAYYNNDTIGTQNVTNLAPGDIETLIFTWDTSGVSPGGYSISAKVPPLPQETDTDDNIRVDGTVTVKAEETPSVDTQWYSLAGIVMVLAGIVMVLAGIVMVISLVIVIYLLRSRK